MGFFKKVRDAVQKVAPRILNAVQQAAPIVQGIASAIPHPYAQGIAKGAGLAGQWAGRANQFINSPRIGLRSFGR